MSINKLRKHQDDIPYTMASREVIQSLDNPVALAIWTYLQSLPENWNVNEGQLRDHFSLGKDRYREAMRQLKEAGLYDLNRLKNDEGKFVGSYFDFYPVPGEVNHMSGKPDVRETICPENRTYIKEEDNNKEEIIIKEKDNGFVFFWESYDKKVGKPKCISIWKKMTQKDRDAAMKGIKTHVAVKEKQYRKDPERYLNHQQWNDEVIGGEVPADDFMKGVK